ncbi:hypothetical protein ABTY59_16655 [Streptomyces sp. NPDC096079]|uniref:hypothetical protein n=1 Tax=Streptomyces sp. NPDC096079 TaxID=3155820 RepID=UPI0033181C29
MTSPVEERLRAALAARAALVTHRDLRRGAPPRGRRRGTRQVRAIALAVLGTAAAVAAVCVLALLPDGSKGPDPVLPARTPSHVGTPPPPTPAPAPPGAPSVSWPRPVESP